MQQPPPPSSNSSAAAASSSNAAHAVFKGLWTNEEEDALVWAFRTVGAERVEVEGWTPVQQHIVDRGFQPRVYEALRAHHRMLEERARAQGVPLEGSIPLPPWTLYEDATILAIDSLLEKSSATLTRARPIVWAQYLHLFPRRGVTDLQNRRIKLRDSAKLKSTREYAAALAKMDKKKRKIEQKNPPTDEPPSRAHPQFHQT
ncbi:hypothetical protein JCM8547_008923 [Rhodosporidiobolus lusitaniae]